MRHAPSLPAQRHPEGPGTAHSDLAGYFRRWQTSLLTPRQRLPASPEPYRHPPVGPCPPRGPAPLQLSANPRDGCPLTPGSTGLQLPTRVGLAERRWSTALTGRRDVPGLDPRSRSRSQPQPRPRPSVPLTYLRTSVLSRLQSMVAAPGSASPRLRALVQPPPARSRPGRRGGRPRPLRAHSPPPAAKGHGSHAGGSEEAARHRRCSRRAGAACACCSAPAPPAAAAPLEPALPRCAPRVTGALCEHARAAAPAPAPRARRDSPARAAPCCFRLPAGREGAVTAPGWLVGCRFPTSLAHSNSKKDAWL